MVRMAKEGVEGGGRKGRDGIRWRSFSVALSAACKAPEKQPE